jgi:hypothetical protein
MLANASGALDTPSKAGMDDMRAPMFVARDEKAAPQNLDPSILLPVAARTFPGNVWF